MPPGFQNASDKTGAGGTVEGEVVRFASYDGMDIPGILYMPHGASAT